MPDLNSPKLVGDVSGTIHATSVDKLKGSAISATAPSSGQVLTWNGTAWAPATASTGGGGGANGLTYYLRFDQAADAPTTNLPGTPKQLGRTGAVAQSLVTSGTLTSGTWTLLAGFVSESVPIDPNITSIPGGLWDINAWALGTANQQSPTSIRAKIYIYDGANAPTLISTSGEQQINTVSAQYSMSALVPQTNVTSTTRIYVEIEVRSTANGHTATLQFGDGTPSHVHTSLPLVGGTGLWKNVSGVLQSPASLLVNADVDDAAAIAQSKIANLTDDLGNKAETTQVQVFTSSSTWTKPANAKQVVVEMVSGGGGGGAGGKATSGTAVYGGTGGGAGGYSRTTISGTDLTDATYAVTVGTGGNGGVFGVSTPTAGTFSGFAPSSAPTAYLARAQSSAQPGQNGGTTAPTAGAGGAPNSNAGGGTSITGTAATGAASQNAPSGGGGGGGISATPQPFNGGNGGLSAFTGLQSIGGGQSSVANGGNSTPSTARSAVSLIINGSGGGGGGASTFASGSGGNGANGSGYGAGGGGGGATIGSGNGGNGGNGAPGIVVITTYF